MDLVLEAKKRFVLIIMILLIFDSTILLNIHFVRQIVAFICLTLLPGLLILQILKLNKIGSTEGLVLSVGLSVSFLMFFGLFINNFLAYFGYEAPLSTISLMTSFNIAIIILAIIGYKINNTQILAFPSINLTLPEKAFLIIPILFPALSLFGIHIMNSTSSNIILMILLLLIPAYVSLMAMLQDRIPERIYPFIIFLISVSLLLMVSLRSNHIMGIDEHREYQLYGLILNAGHWSILEPDNIINTCLSVTLLPVIYQSLLRMDGEYIFKILYSFFFSLSPIIIYIISKKYVNNLCAFFASIFFIAYPAFFWAELNFRTRVAVIFFALAFMVLFLDNLNNLNKRVLFIFFADSCIVSHYATSYIFFFVLLLTLIGMKLIPILDVGSHKSLNVEPFWDNSRRSLAIILNPSSLKMKVSMTTLILFLVTLFYWYSQLTGVAFTSGLGFMWTTFMNLNQFFVLESRGVTTSDILGTSVAYSRILPKIELILSRLSLIFIAIGVLSTIWNHKKRIFYPNFEYDHTDKFLRCKIDMNLFVLAMVCSLVSAAAFILPYLARNYTLGRTYQQMFIILSMFFVIGGMTVAKWINVKPCLILLIVLIPSFMCGSDTLNQMFDMPRSVVLNSEGYAYDYLFVHDQESYSAKWLKEYCQYDGFKVYTDVTGQYRLISQAGIPLGSIDYTSLIDKRKKISDGYIYLRYYNVFNRKLADRAYMGHDIVEYLDRFIMRRLIYSNGGSEIYL